MKINLLQLLTLVFFTATSAFAVDVDLKGSSLKWTGKKKLVDSKHVGNVPLKSGSLEIKDGEVTGGEFIADLTNFTVTDLDGALAKKFLGHMKSADFFEVEKYPTAKIKIKSVKDGKATADLTIKGKTNEVMFDMKKDKDGAYTGMLKFDRTKFDMKYGSDNFFKNLGDKVIHNDVVVDFNIAVKK